MSEGQIDLSNYRSEVVEQKTFDDQNKGKPLLNSDDEYVFKLIKFPHGYKKVDETKNDDGTVKSVTKTMAVCEFEDQTHKNIVTTQFRIDKLNFGTDEKYKSGVVKFFQKLGSPLTENKTPDWKDHFVPGMRFRGRVVVKTMKDKDNKDVTKYYLDVPTVRKLMASDTAGESFAQPTAQKPDASLANALFLAKGAKDFHEAMAMLEKANASKEVTMALFQANLDNAVHFPL
jgi:hypothetical protein